MVVKKKALLSVVQAYMNRGKYIQYDQRCMDRTSFLTPRRDKCLPPEAATEQHTLYLDCSSYIGTVFYEAFGYELPFDLTWHMIDYLQPRVFFYEMKHNETANELLNLKKSIEDLLVVGDVITYDCYSGSGHTVLYIGDGKYSHCTTNGRPDSYDYVERKNREYDDGGLFIEDISTLFETRLYVNPNIHRIAIHRPLDVLEKPTNNTLLRLDKMSNLVCSVETSHPGRYNAVYGETIVYNVIVLNKDNKDKGISIEFYLKGRDVRRKTVIIKAGEKEVFSFENIVKNDESFGNSCPVVKINGMNVYVPEVFVGNGVSDEDIYEIAHKIEDEINLGNSVVLAAHNVYKKYSLDIDETEKAFIYKYFYLHDSKSGDVLSRRTQKPVYDMGVYSFYGGTGVITPQRINNSNIRCNQIRKTDFKPGDLIICCDDPYATKTYSCLYTGETFIGRFEYGEAIKKFSQEETLDFIESLLGRFCFVVVRPSLAKK